MPLQEDIKKEVSYDYFWNSNNDRYYDANSFGDFFRPFFRNGVFNGEMQVKANEDMSVTVAAGHGFINGKMRHFLAETRLDIETSSGTLDRIDNVIIRRNDTERSITLLIQKGGNASSPVPPAIVRDAAIFDLKLAEIYIAAGAVKISQAQITDTRMNNDVCGWVAATVKEIEFKQIQAQFDSYFSNYKKNVSDQFATYRAAIQSLEQQAQESYDGMMKAFEAYEAEQKSIIEAWFSGQETDFSEWSERQQSTFAQWRQNQESAFNNWYLNNTGTWSNDFANWFQSMKDQLDESQAGHLQNQIDTLNGILYSGEVPAELLTSDEDNLVTSSGDQLICFWTIKTSETCGCIAK